MPASVTVMLTFLVYSIAMFVLPILTFFTVRSILEKNFHITGFTNMAWSVICAVIVVNIIIMAYAWTAFKHEQEEEEEKREKEIEKEKEQEESVPITDQDTPVPNETDLIIKKDE